MIPRRVYLAILLGFLIHGFFILTARYRLSYDAYTHMLFADHYASNWFSLWETRWYTGFEVVSYPPLTHQLIALFVPLIGFDKAYALILWLVTSLFPFGIYTFSRVFTGKSTSSYAALASALLLPLYVTAHIFGQLPFLTATLFALFGVAAITKFLREGGLSAFLLAVYNTATTMAAHHATLMIQPFFILALTFFQLKQNNWKTIISRLAIFLAFAIPTCIIVIWPFWQWGMHQQLQTPIDHLSRHNFFTDPFASVIFFWPFYFPIGIIIPFLFYKWPRKFLGLQFSFVILFILGLGGTTPLPSLLFGKSWEWLTYDRFALWAALTLTPFFGILFIKFRKWMKNHITLNLISASLRGTSISAVTFSIFTCAAIGSWFTPTFFPVQPAPIDMQPIVNFLNAEDHSTWRYITFGFGDQFAYLNLLTTAATLDGSYHTARTVPELRESGIGQIDTAYWALKGIPAISPILQASGKYGVRWGFVSLRSFVPELKKAGWKFVKYLPNGIQVWENPDFTYWPSKPPPVDTFKSFSWGIFPMVSLLITLTLGTVHILKDRSEKIIRNGHTLVVGLIPLSLGFWYYQTIFEFNHKQVYFTYSNALFFLSDGLALIAVILWLAVSVPRNSFRPQSATVKLLFVLCSLITLSALWSLDPRTSIYIAMHFWLVLGLIHSMRDWHESWKAVILGFCAALSIQALMGIVGFIGQSTVFLGPLGLSWPGPITAATRAASIIKLAGGQSFLRAYGTFPHPNILGGFTVACLAATSALLLRDKKPNRLAALLLILGSSLLALTFSRSAWVAIIIFLTAIIFKSKYLDRKSVAILCITIILALGTTLIPLRNLFLNRTTAPSTNIEGFSLVGRIWLAQQAIAYIKEKPVLGVGAGSFVIQLAERSGKYNYIEPVHSIPLQVAAELGIIGFILLFAIAISIGRSFFETKKTNAIIMGALLIGLGTISLFDHYLWTLAPGRMLLGLVLGLWEGQIARDE